MTEKEALIKECGDKNNLWYVDVKGVNQDGDEVWLSGNLLDQDQAGYGGFHSYKEAMDLINNFENIFNPSAADLTYCSETGVEVFYPKKVYLGFAPLYDDDGDENRIWLERTLREVNLAKALCKNLNCWGYIYKVGDGYQYQNDNDLGLDLEPLNQPVPYIKKIYITGRYYAYLLSEKAVEGEPLSLELVKALLHECHKHVVELNQKEKDLVYNYWLPFATPR